MVKIAVVDDEQTEREGLKDFLSKYQEEHGCSFLIECFQGGVALLCEDVASYDIIFLDIEMPYMNGMETARQIRTVNNTCKIVFVTNMIQYAIDGYSVDAVDYIVKPVSWEAFSFKFQRVMDKIGTGQKHELLLKTPDGLVRLDVADICYVEVIKHELLYHTKKGVYRMWGSLSAVEEELSAYHFTRCNVCYLVNLQYVTDVTGSDVCVNGERLRVSGPKKKDFLMALMTYMKGGG